VIIGMTFAGGVIVVGLPVFGANWGSAVVLTVALGLTYALLRPRRIRGRDLAAIAAAAVLVAVGLLALDYVWAGRQSHMGSAARFLLAGDMGAAWSMYLGKMARNWAVLGLSPFVLGFLAMVAAMAYLLIWPPPRMAAVLSRHRPVAAALTGCLAGMLVGLGVNDTGAVAGALISLFIMHTMVYLVLLPGESDASVGG
jgi:hypothetical protein